ncbi:reverse transcriptase domain-containing protein [Francisellaceae bacterium]|nr:reverse transcriptase domain-containing protein [Francisellaceae bacterium]
MQSKTKERIIYDYTLTDKIVMGVVSQVMNELLEQVMSDKSYAFRQGSSPHHVARHFCNYIKEYNKKGHRDFYIFRTDFVAYSDEINVRENSIFWDNLDELFKLFKIKPTPYQFKMIKEIIRPEFYNLEGNLQSNLSGVPTGTSMITFINNFYAYKIDNVIARDENIFYARYCDDILICHHNQDYLKEKGKDLVQMIYDISLQTNEKKDFWGYFTSNGKPCSDNLFTGTNSYDYLGYKITAKGTFSLSTARQRKFLRVIYMRIRSICRSAKFDSDDHKGLVLCHALNDAIATTTIGEQAAVSIIRESSDHGQLKNIDYQIALKIAEAISNIKGVKAFRKIPYKKIRNKYKLMSLVNLRNEYRP